MNKEIRPLIKLFLITFFLFGCGSQAGEGERFSKRIKAPIFELKDLEGKKISLDSFKGRVVFLDFWATWCPPCRVSAPQVERLIQDYKGKPVDVISISLDDSVEPVREFVKNKELTGINLMAGNSAVNSDYSVRGVPTFYVIDQEGYVVTGWSGYAASFPRAWRKEIDALLKP